MAPSLVPSHIKRHRTLAPTCNTLHADKSGATSPRETGLVPTTSSEPLQKPQNAASIKKRVCTIVLIVVQKARNTGKLLRLTRLPAEPAENQSMPTSSSIPSDCTPFALAACISAEDLMTAIHMRHKFTSAPHLSGEQSPCPLQRARALELEKDLLEHLRGPAETTHTAPSRQTLSKESKTSADEHNIKEVLQGLPLDMTSNTHSKGSGTAALESNDSDTEYICDDSIISQYCSMREEGLIAATPPASPRRVR